MHYLMCHCSNLYHVCNNIYNNNWFFILITQLLANYFQWRCSNHNCFVHTLLHTRLTEFLLTLSFLFICARLQSDEFYQSRMLSRMFVFLLHYCLCILFALLAVYSLMSIFFSHGAVVVGLLITRSMYVLV